MEDNHLIASASGGRALRGVMVGGSDGEGRGQCLKQVLRQPENCQLRGPLQHHTYRSLCFSTVEEYSRFRETLEQSKWSAAIHTGPMGFGQVSAGTARDKMQGNNSTATQRSTSLTQMACSYFPKASFNIPRHEMRLSKEALDDALRVRSPYDASRFLEIYGSHVSSGNYHLGGLLMKIVTIEAQSATSVEVLKESAASNFHAEFDINYLGYAPGAKTVSLADDTSTSDDQHKSHKATMNSSLVTMGPNIAEEKDFEAQLDKDRSTWHVIDMTNDGADDLVPIWEVATLADDGALDLAKFTNLLRDAWHSHIRQIPGALNDLTVNKLWEHSSIKRISSGSLDNVQTALTNLRSRLGVENPIKPPPSARDVVSILKDVWLQATSTRADDMHDIDRRHDNLVQLFSSPDFVGFLQFIAQSKDSQMDPAKDVIRQLINRDVQTVLEMAGSSLPQEVREVLSVPSGSNQSREPGSTRIPSATSLPPIQHIAPSELRRSLIGILTARDNLWASSVTKAVRNCLREEAATNEVKAQIAVRKIVKNYGFGDDGDYGYDLDRLVIEDVEEMIEDLESLTNANTSVVRTTSIANSPIFATDSSCMPPHDVEELKTYAIASEKVNMYTKGIVTYNRDVLVDRPFESRNPDRRMLDSLRHRMEPFSTTSIQIKEELPTHDRDQDPDQDSDDSYSSDDPDTNHEPSPFERLLQLLTSSELLAQIALFQLLLEQRFAVPLVVPALYRDRWSTVMHNSMITCSIHEDRATSPHTDAPNFLHLCEALEYVQVKLADQQTLDIANDTTLPRVVFVSDRKTRTRSEMPAMASEVMNCEFASKHREGWTGDGPLVELSVGFVAIKATSRRPADQVMVTHDKHMPCLVLCVWGNHPLLGSFLGKVANMVVVEMDPDGEPSRVPWITDHKQHVLYWNINSAEKRIKPKRGTEFKQIYGSFKDLTVAIGDYLVGRDMGVKKLKSFAASEYVGPDTPVGVTLTLQECLDISMDPLNKKTQVICMDDSHGIAKAREYFLLQKSYVKEAEKYFNALVLNRSSLNKELENERKKRTDWAVKVQELPILKYFVRLLSEEDVMRRNVSILHFELLIKTKLESPLKAAADKVNAAFKQWEINPQHSRLKQKYVQARKSHVDQMLGLEHLWRELSHIFTADTRKKKLPLLAVRHLLDGFPLEILDGDAPIFKKLWVDSVLVELQRTLQSNLQRKPRVFVLSVLGIQSSGKSTLLNLMFGTRLKTSAGQCTRGVYLQLVKSDWPGYDYVLLLDTEGLRATEFFGLKDSELKDNRLATFAVLPADACVIMVTNEEDNGLKEVLPMVMLAFIKSTMAQEYGRMQPELLFVYRSVDTNDKGKLAKNEQKLREHLRESASDIASYGMESTPRVNTPLYGHVRFPVDEVVVKYFGNLKRGNVPPLDVPDWDYGSNVVDLRECIHNRASKRIDWENHDLNKWTVYLGQVVQCIADSNFEHTFPDLMNYHNYNELQASVAKCRQKVGMTYMNTCERLERDLKQKRSEDITTYMNTCERLERDLKQKRSEDITLQKAALIKNLESSASETVENVTKEVSTVLEEKQYYKWKAETEGQWNEFLADKLRYWSRVVEDLIDGLVNFENKVGEYNQQVQKEIETEAENYRVDRTQDNWEDKMQSHFKNLFERILEDAKGKHPPMETRVEGKVLDVYQKSPVLGRMYIFSASDSSSPTPPKQRSDNLVVRTFNKVFVSKSDDVQQDPETILKDKIQTYLTDSDHEVKQYEDHCVEEVINITNKVIRQHRIQEHQKKFALHVFAKGFLTEKLKIIQHEWDKHHNVARRLEMERDRLRNFFRNCANRVGGTQLLKEDIENVLKENLEGAFNVALRDKVCHQIQDAPWVCNPRIVKAYLELYLVKLIEDEKTNELLRCVSDGARHYRLVLDKLIQAEINRVLGEKLIWPSFVYGMKQSLTNALLSLATVSDASLKSDIFLRKLEEQLRNEAKCPKLAEHILGLSPKVYAKYSQDIDFSEVAQAVSKGLDGVQLSPSCCGDNEMVSLVRDRMIKCDTDSARPRCDTMCPLCHVTCFHPVGHNGNHDTMHQPTGLRGMVWESTGELTYFTCQDAFSLDYAVKAPELTHGDDFVQFRDWEKYFPTWQAPTNTNVDPLHLREYVYANYQSQLVEFYMDTKTCSEIPFRFTAHDLNSVRCHFESIVDKHSSQSYALPPFLAHNQ